MQLDKKEAFYDLQGRMLLEVTLNDDDYVKILERYDKHLVVDKVVAKRKLIELLGHGISTTTNISLDIKGIAHNGKRLESQFFKWLTTDKAGKNRKSDAIYGELMGSSSRGSVTGLGEEMRSHYHGLMRAMISGLGLMKISVQPEQVRQLKEKISKIVSVELSDVYYQALLNSFNSNGKIEVAVLNQLLDKARPKLYKLVKETLLKEVRAEFFAKQSVTQWNQYLSKLDTKFLSKFTATGRDYLRTDGTLGIATYIQGTNKASHAKRAGKENHTLRPIIYSQYSEVNHQPIISNTNLTSIHARVSSFLPEKTVGTTVALINDVWQKFEDIYRRQLELSAMQLSDQKPMIYNLLTSLGAGLTGGASNNQEKNADLIIKGAHRFNLAYSQAGPLSPRWYVQNIGVNQHGSDMGYGLFKTKTTEEATLMSELALLSTLKKYTPEIGELCVIAEKQYQSFLLRQANQIRLGSAYFSQSPEGQQLRQAIAAFKAKKNIFKPRLDDIQDLAAAALFKLTFGGNNFHWQKRYGTLVQTLSAFCEQSAILGCKSGNERFQQVAGRLELLERMRFHPNKNFEDQLKRFIETNNPAALELSLSQLYNEQGVANSMSEISREDQWSGSKVLSYLKSKFLSYFNTNYSESPAVTNLQASHAAKGQVHKLQLKTKGFFSWIKNQVKGFLFRDDSRNAPPVAVINQRDGVNFGDMTNRVGGNLQAATHADHQVEPPAAKPQVVSPKSSSHPAPEAKDEDQSDYQP